MNGKIACLSNPTKHFFNSVPLLFCTAEIYTCKRIAILKPRYSILSPLVITTVLNSELFIYLHAMAGIVAVSIEQNINALGLIFVTLSGIVMLLSELQLLNA